MLQLIDSTGVLDCLPHLTHFIAKVGLWHHPVPMNGFSYYNECLDTGDHSVFTHCNPNVHRQ